MQLILRFIVGGMVVSIFAALGDALKPKSFAGLFGAAPSVALATLGLAIAQDGRLYASQEARSMIIGAVAILAYAWCCMLLMGRYRLHALGATVIALPVWLACALGGWALFLR